MFLRLSHLFMTLIATVFFSPLFSVPMALIYSFRYFAPELIVFGLVLDVTFGVTSEWPLYTMTAFLIIVIGEMTKRFILK